MKIFKIYHLIATVLFFCCENSNVKPIRKLIKHTVYIFNYPENDKKTIVNEDTSYVECIFKNQGLINIHTLDSSIKVNLRYSDTNNFLKINFYDGLKKAYLPCEVAIRVCNAQYYLKQINSNYSLLILDASRPLILQQMMWDSLKMPPDIKYNYLSPPYSISLHNYGCAIDATIIDLATGKELDMGSDFDQFEKISQPVYEWQFLKSGKLSKKSYENRVLLRKVMRMANLNHIKSEWWHFNYCTKEFASKNFKLIK